MAIEGYYQDDHGAPVAPYIKVQVAIPDLHLLGDVEFLVDTGADATTLMPDDLAKLGVDIQAVSGPMKTADGSGGASEYKETKAELRFNDDAALGRFQDFGAVIHLSANPENAQLPSLLGRDILNRCQCTFDAAQETATLKRNKGDESIFLQ